jgi:hypothetical protein
MKRTMREAVALMTQSRPSGGGQQASGHRKRLELGLTRAERLKTASRDGCAAPGRRATGDAMPANRAEFR